MNYKITVEIDGETAYTHEWENEADNIRFGHTERLANATDEELNTLSGVAYALSIAFDAHKHVDVADRPTETLTEPFSPPDYVEGRMMQQMLSDILGQIEQEAFFADVEASA